MEGIIWGYERLGRVKRKRGGEEIGDDVCEGRVKVVEKFWGLRRMEC